MLEVFCMRIGFYTDSYLPNVDGVVNAILNYRRELQARGHRISVYTSGTRDEAAANDDPHAHYYFSVRLPLYPQYKVAVLPHTAPDARREKIGLVHSHAMATMGLAASRTAEKLGVPLVGTFHTLVPTGARDYIPLSFLKRPVEHAAWRFFKSFYQPFDVVTAPTKTIERTLNAHDILNTVVVPNGIDTTKFNPRLDSRPVRTLLSVPEGENLVLVAGRQGFEKNIDVLLRAFALLRKRNPRLRFRAILTGEGPALLHNRKLAERLRLGNVVFTGFLRSFELPYYHAASKVFMTASTFETQGLAFLEAMAVGRPVVGADALAIPESLHEGYNGFLFEPFNIKQAADRLETVLEMEGKAYRRLQRNARTTAEHFSIPKSTDTLLAAYRNVMD